MNFQIRIQRLYDVAFYMLLFTFMLCYPLAWWDLIRPELEICQQRPQIVTFPPFVSDTIDVGMSSGIGIIGVVLVSVMFLPIWSTRCDHNRRMWASLPLAQRVRKWKYALSINEWIGCVTFLANIGVVAFRLNVDVVTHLVFAVFHFAGMALILGFQHLYDEMIYQHKTSILPSQQAGRMPLRRQLFKAACACLTGLVVVGLWILLCPVDPSIPHGTLMLNANQSPILKQILAWCEVSVFILFNYQWYMWRYAFSAVDTCAIHISLIHNSAVMSIPQPQLFSTKHPQTSQQQMVTDSALLLKTK